MRVPSRPTPPGLGRRHRLARPLSASDASSVSPDPSRARAPTPLLQIPRHRARLPTHGARTHDRTGAVTPISQQGMAATIPTTLVAVTLPLSLCDLTSFTVVYRLTVKEEWERLTSVTVSCLFPLLQDRLQYHRSDPHDSNRSNHAVSHASRTIWASFYRVRTVASPFSRGNLQSHM